MRIYEYISELLVTLCIFRELLFGVDTRPSNFALVFFICVIPGVPRFGKSCMVRPVLNSSGRYYPILILLLGSYIVGSKRPLDPITRERELSSFSCHHLLIFIEGRGVSNPVTKITGCTKTCQQKILNLQRRHLKGKKTTIGSFKNTMMIIILLINNSCI